MQIVAPLQDAGLADRRAFDEPIDFIYFNLWHHWGRTAKFGTWMQGPDYSQWHGAYEMLHPGRAAELADEKLRTGRMRRRGRAGQ